MPANKKKSKGSVMARLKKKNTIKEAEILSQSKFFVEEYYDTGIPALNIALSAKVDGGFSKGTTLIVGQSKTFKTMFMLAMARAYLNQHPDAVFVFYDIEFGSNSNSFESMGIDPDRVYHKPIKNIDILTTDFVNMFEGEDALTDEDDIFIGIDSLGAIASKKQQDDAKSGSEKVDMTRAKKLKNFWQLATPILNINNVPMAAIGSSYADQSVTYTKEIIGGGRAMEFFPNNIWMISKLLLRDKDKKVIGSYFKIKVHKSRLVKENSEFLIEVSHNEGINKYSSLITIALDLGFVEQGKIRNAHAYYPKGKEHLKARPEDCATAEFWDDVIKDPEFIKKVEQRYALGSLTDPETTGLHVEFGGTLEEVGNEDDPKNKPKTKPKSKTSRKYQLQKKEAEIDLEDL